MLSCEQKTKHYALQVTFKRKHLLYIYWRDITTTQNSVYWKISEAIGPFRNYENPESSIVHHLHKFQAFQVSSPNALTSMVMPSSLGKLQMEYILPDWKFNNQNFWKILFVS